MKVVQLFKIYNFDVVQKIYLTNDLGAKIKNIEGILNSRKFAFFKAKSLQLQTQKQKWLPCNKYTETLQKHPP